MSIGRQVSIGFPDPNRKIALAHSLFVDRVDVSTVVYLPPAEIFEFLVDFPRYARYSEYLDSVVQHGDGSVGTEYDLTFSWWRLSHTVRSQVTAIDPAERIDWQVIDELDAQGYWTVTPTPDAAPADHDTASRVRFVAEFDPGSIGPGVVDIPSVVSVEWILARVKPLIYREVKRVVSRVVADLEGQQREITLTVHEKPDSV